TLYFIPMILRPLNPTLFPYTTLFRSCAPRFSVRPPIREPSQPGLGRQPRFPPPAVGGRHPAQLGRRQLPGRGGIPRPAGDGFRRSEEHTSELQSRGHLVCRLLLEKKN